MGELNHRLTELVSKELDNKFNSFQNDQENLKVMLKDKTHLESSNIKKAAANKINI